MTFDQSGFQVRCEWGRPGLNALTPISDVVVIVDVLSFTSAVDVATARGAMILPYPSKGDAAAAYAASIDAHLASADRGHGFSLSPASLRNIPARYRLVLPSPNGAALSFGLDRPRVLAGCLRNAKAVAACAARLGSTIAVIPAGEVWPGGELRPCVEDLIGAGGIIANCAGSRSPEAMMAVAAFERCRADLAATLRRCGSGKELIERGFGLDVELAAQLDVSSNAPRLVNGEFLLNSA